MAVPGRNGTGRSRNGGSAAGTHREGVEAAVPDRDGVRGRRMRTRAAPSEVTSIAPPPPDIGNETTADWDGWERGASLVLRADLQYMESGECLLLSALALTSPSTAHTHATERTRVCQSDHRDDGWR